MNLKLISCEIFFREMWHAAARSPHRIDIEFLPKALHDRGGKAMVGIIQEHINQVPADEYEAILLGYGLCNNGIDGLAAAELPMVVPRAHDCITLFFGSREKYLGYFNANPGTYFKTSGWIEKGADRSANQLPLQPFADMSQDYEALAEKYGEDNARYIIESLHSYKVKYNRIAYIEMGVEPDDRFERQSRETALQAGWEFEKIRGDMSIIFDLVNGNWNERDFLVVPPGHRIRATYRDEIIDSEPIAV